MSLTPSTMLALGTAAPEFKLPEVITGKSLSLAELPADKPVLMMFICCHCPFVKHVQDELTRIGEDYGDRISIVAITANDVDNYPADSPEKFKQMATELGWNFYACYDDTQAVAKAYTAACTPDFFLFGRDRRLVYRGQLDDSRPGNGKPVTGADLRAAMDAVLVATPVSAEQLPSIGCNIKWKPG
ncbi:MAG: thioredoxin family protein, partial [Cyanobacteria bacterium P01_E01_bin.34]